MPFGVEKGIDVRTAIDIITLALKNQYDIAVIFSQDQNLSEAATEIKAIARDTKCYIKLVSAFPGSLKHKYKRGINGTDWLPISAYEFKVCLDKKDYFSKTK